MTPTNDDVIVSESVVAAARTYQERQDEARGHWPNPRAGAEMPNPPYPHPENPMLAYLIHRAKASMEQGTSLETAIWHLAVHSWHEGHVEGYDRGQSSDARSDNG
jgi:hypothetical protein